MSGGGVYKPFNPPVIYDTSPGLPSFWATCWGPQRDAGGGDVADLMGATSAGVRSATGLTWDNGSSGRILTGNGTAGALSFANFKPGPVTQLAIGFRLRLNTVPSSAGVIAETTTNFNAGGTGLIAYVESSDITFGFQNPGLGYCNGTIAPPTVGVWTDYVFCLDRTAPTAAAAISAYVNAVPTAITLTNNSTPAGTFNSTGLYLFARGGSSLFAPISLSHFSLWAGRIPGAAEIALQSARPWRRLEPSARLRRMVSSSVANVGTATGSATASGVGIAAVRAVGSATGLAVVTGFGSSIVIATATASGVASASAFGASNDQTAGLAVGLATALGTGSSLATASGSASGSSSAVAVGITVIATAGSATGVSIVSGVSGSGVIAGSLFEAIRSRILTGVPSLSDCYRRETPGKTAAGTPPVTPYCIYNVLREAPVWVSGSGYYPAWLEVQLTFVHTDDELGEQARDAAYLLFTPRRNSDGSPANTLPVFNGGGVPPYGFLPGVKTEYKNPGKVTGGQPLWMFSFPVQFYVTRAK